jgi:hypothetical protein
MNRSLMNPNLKNPSLMNLSLTQNRLSRIRMNLNLMNLNLMNPNLMNPNLMSRILTSRNLMSRILTPQRRLRHLQDLLYKQIDKRKKGLRARGKTVNDGTSLTLPLNRPALVPIVRGEELACL